MTRPWGFLARLGLGSALAVSLASCGLFSAAAPSSGHAGRPTPPRTHSHGSGSTKTGGAGRGTNGSGTAGHSGSGGQNSPPPPNVGSYQDLELSVLAVTDVGSTTISGQPLTVYQLQLQVYNSTPALIVLALDDLSAVSTSGPPSYSWNDYDAAGLTKSNSLFWPISSPLTPAAVTTAVDAGSRITGDLNVAVPAGTAYQIVWGAPTSGDVAATFSPPGQSS